MRERKLAWGVFAGLVLGFGISFLGVFFWSHSLRVVASQSKRIRLEQLQDDREWNPIRFNSQLLCLWFRDHVLGEDADQFWPPDGHPWWIQVGEELPPKSLPIRFVCGPTLRRCPSCFHPGDAGKRSRI